MDDSLPVAADAIGTSDASRRCLWLGVTELMSGLVDGVGGWIARSLKRDVRRLKLAARLCRRSLIATLIPDTRFLPQQKD